MERNSCCRVQSASICSFVMADKAEAVKGMSSIKVNHRKADFITKFLLPIRIPYSPYFTVKYGSSLFLGKKKSNCLAGLLRQDIIFIDKRKQGLTPAHERILCINTGQDSAGSVPDFAVVVLLPAKKGQTTQKQQVVVFLLLVFKYFWVVSPFFAPVLFFVIGSARQLRMVME